MEFNELRRPITTLVIQLNIYPNTRWNCELLFVYLMLGCNEMKLTMCDTIVQITQP